VNKEREQVIIAALQANGINKPCPRCGNSAFQLLGEALIGLNEDPENDNSARPHRDLPSWLHPGVGLGVLAGWQQDHPYG
jgi:hypothetical protein